MEQKARGLTAIYLVTRLRGVVPICEADKREALGSSCISILGQEDSGDPTKSLKDFAK
ncbi:MAG: hypothetical protein Q9222_001795, partial [Ikaeria aurantiellina]